MSRAYGVIDVGTTSIKLKVYDGNFNVVYDERVYARTQLSSDMRAHNPTILKEAFEHFIRKARSLGVRRLGISTYRASVLAWDKNGNPLTDIITWLDRRPAEVLSRPLYRILKLIPPLDKILRVDSPAVKMKWLLETRGDLKARVERGDAYVGTVSSYIAFLVSRRYVNDVTNEALTGLLHPKTLKRLTVTYEILGIPKAVDPEVVDNNAYIGSVDGVDVVALIADQQAAVIGSSCFNLGCVKLTSGTGVFADTPTRDFMMPGRGLIPVVLYSIDGRRGYGIEGFNQSGGTVLEWLLSVELLRDLSEVDELVERAKASIVFQPSITGMSFPTSRSYGSGLLYGMRPGMTRADVVRGFIEGLALASCSIVKTVGEVAGGVKVIRADGGVSRSSSYLKLLSTACGVAVERVRGCDATGRGVALLVALYEGGISFDDLVRLADIDLTVKPGDSVIKTDLRLWEESSRWDLRVS